MSAPILPGFSRPAGNPTTEPRSSAFARLAVAVHYHRMFVGESVPDHTTARKKGIASRGAHGGIRPPARDGEARRHRDGAHGDELHARQGGRGGAGAKMERATGIPFITAFGSVVAALAHLQAKQRRTRHALRPEWTLRGKSHWKRMASRSRAGVISTMSPTSTMRRRSVAYALATPRRRSRSAGRVPVGRRMPTIDVLERLERDLGKPAISSCSAMVWNALRIAGRRTRSRLRKIVQAMRRTA
jgi:maleate isomerase